MMFILRLLIALLFIPVLASGQEETLPLPSASTFKKTSTTVKAAQHLDSLQLIETESGTDIEISGDGSLEYSYYSLAEPARLVIDFRNVQSQLNCQPVQNPYINSVRCFDLWGTGAIENAVRIVLEFKAHVRFSANPRSNGLTLQFMVIQPSVPSVPAQETQTEPPPEISKKNEQAQTETSPDSNKNVQPGTNDQTALKSEQTLPSTTNPGSATSTSQEPKQEPVKQESAKQEPAKQEPAKQEPAKQEPAKQEPAKQEPAKQEPAIRSEVPALPPPPAAKGTILIPAGTIDLEPANADPALFFTVPSNSTDYVLGPEDVIDVKVQQLEELNVTVRIAGDGSINLPFLGSVSVAGMTAVDVSKKIAKLLGEQFLQNPQVSVFAKEFNSQKISVIGAVQTPGTYPLVGPRTIIQMLAQAGGIRPDAGTGILIFRQDTKGQSTRLSIQRENLLVKGDPAWNIWLRAGDVVNIPPQIQISISLFGAVATPGVYTLAAGSESTLLKAIARAGGLQRASKSGVKIKRKAADGKEEILTINLGEILSGKKPDIQLEDGDLIIINESFF